MRKVLCLLILFTMVCNFACCEEIKYILHDRCINILYKPAVAYFKDSNIRVLRDSRGIILRFELKNPDSEYVEFSDETKQNIKKIAYFLAKNKNAVIIEVHSSVASNSSCNLKNWERTAVIAANIENVVRSGMQKADKLIHSVGFGEFLPENNTPNNGGKLLNRVDIIILCNVSGE